MQIKMQRNFNESIKKAQSGVNAGRKEAKSRLRREKQPPGSHTRKAGWQMLISIDYIRQIKIVM